MPAPVTPPPTDDGATPGAVPGAEGVEPRTRWRERSPWLRGTVYAAVGLVLALVATSVLAVTTVRSSFPQTEGTIDVPGLSADVRVVRDDAGVPQIWADTPEDLFFAQGFVQAQDRFFEMDVRRHITAGRLSELFGEETLETDKVVRAMGWRRVAEEEVARLDPTTVNYLEAFSAGVNAYVADRSPGELSLEYTLLSLGGLDDYAVEAWTPADSVAWLKAIAWDLRGNMQDEVDRAMASSRVDPERVEELYPAYPYARHRPIVTGSRSAARTGTVPSYGRHPEKAAVRALEATDRALDAVPTMVGTGEGVGSNAWVVDGDHSTTGMPILANDPHLAPTLPGVWYQMGLHCNVVDDECPFDVAGFTFAGLPGVVIGHNRDIAWGFTNLGPDVTDLYLEAVDGERYLRGKEWRPFRRRTETIEIAGEEPFTFTVRTSVHGPLISDVAPDFASVGANAPAPEGSPERGEGYAVALSWTALSTTRTAEAIFDMARASGWDEFRAAAAKFAAPSQNMVYADREGNIGYQAPGLIPVRGRAHDGNWPAPGWDPAYDWTGDHVPFDALPSVLNPPEGYVVTANQAPVGPDYPHRLGEAWDLGYRSQRLFELIESQEKFSPDDMARLQLDTRNGLAPTLVPYLLDVDPGSHYYRAGQRLLRRWDFTQPPDSAAAAYYNAVWRNLLELTFDDELPASVEVDGNSRWFEVVRGLLEEPSDPWWDDVDTDDVVERRDDVLVEAVRAARDELVRLQSRRADRWTWGHQHRLTLENQTVGQSDVGLVARLVNRGDWELGGGSSIVDATGWNAEEGYEVTWVPSMRMVVSMADLDDSTWINLTGASGHAFHPHYTDQTDLWAEGRTRPWPFSREAVEEAGEDVLTLATTRRE
ncbi:penicillin acylase family protein [Nocardioides caldifontis]|uniref:penicillin acylase family protein n=1 Tax=Nocardioides caldifontis TaxID=2588938 RepID=UPI001EF02758|nr:penicillin acylase family protein [Nocardioides caldifontis]